MGLRERYDFDSLVNEAERLVIEEMGRQLPRNKGLCTCEECVLDIAAFALNPAPPSLWRCPPPPLCPSPPRLFSAPSAPSCVLPRRYCGPSARLFCRIDLQ